MKRRKALLLLSGGLDSTIVAHMMNEQNIELVCVHFSSPFCTCNSGCGKNNFAKETADRLELKLINEFMGEEYIDMVRNPDHGYGRNMNPCIDCRIFKFKKAKEIMLANSADFIITGEVVGQRPMSQFKRTMSLIENEADLAGLVLRPLSSGLLEETVAEKNKWVDRTKLMSLSGRSRKEQFKLAEKYELSEKDYACPAGGCKLTTAQYSNKLKDLFAHKDEVVLKDILYLNAGRHFRITEDYKIIIGRNENENNILTKMHEKYDMILSPLDVNGPVCIGLGKEHAENLLLAAEISASYINRPETKEVCFEYNYGNETGTIKVKRKEREDFSEFKINT